MYFIGAALVMLVPTIVCYFKGVPFSMYLNPAAISVVLLTIAGLIVATSNFKTFISGLNAVLSPKYVISDEEREKAAHLFRLLSKGVVVTSIATFFIGLIAGFSHFWDPSLMVHAFAAALVSPIISIMVSLAFFEPAVCVLRKPRSNPEAQDVATQD